MSATGQTGYSSRVAELRDNVEVRLIGSMVLVGALLALVTGPDGSQNDPTKGIKGSLFSIRLLVCVALTEGVAGLIIVVRRRHQLVEVQRARVSAITSRVTTHRRVVQLVGVAFLVWVIFIPNYLSHFWQTVFVDEIGIFVLLALGLNVVVGLAGLLDLGYIAFYAIGAYTTAYFTGNLKVHPPFTLTPFLVMPLAVLAAMIAGIILGGPTLRLRGDYLAIVTLGFGEIVRITANNSDSITNGPQGAVGVPHFSAFGYHWSIDSMPYWYLLVGVVVLICFFFYRLENSRVGRAWTAIREDEIAASASGIPTLRFKLLAFAIGASTSGFAGVIFASKVGSFTPDNFLFINSILVLAMVIFGGMGSMAGVILGAVVLGGLPELLRDYVPPTDRYIYFGAMLVIMMIFRPQGLLPSRRRAREIALSEEGIGSADSLGPTGGAV